MALAGQKCTSSQWVCIEHFTSADYTISKDGKNFKLKPSAVPSLFDVYLIEINEEEDQNDMNYQVVDITELQVLRSENVKLNEAIEQLKRKQKSEKMIVEARIAHLNATKIKNTKEIHSLKKQVADLEKKLAEAQETIDSYTANIQVNIFFEFI